MSFFDFLFNVCRSFSDFLHICAYLLVAIIAILIAIYKYDSSIYTKYVIMPIVFQILTFSLECTKKVTSSDQVLGKGRKPIHSRGRKNSTWAPASNRVPYYVRAIKNIIKRFQ